MPLVLAPDENVTSLAVIGVYVPARALDQARSPIALTPLSLPVYVKSTAFSDLIFRVHARFALIANVGPELLICGVERFRRV